MGKAQPTPPPPQQTSALSIPPPPVPSLDIPKVSDRETSDPDIEKILDQIRERQWSDDAKIKNLTAGDLAFAMMRNVPREHWDTPLARLGHFPRGSTIAEIKANPELKNFTPAQAILKLFEMDDEIKAKKEKK